MIASGHALHLAEYGKVSEAELETSGMLGFDFIRAHGAVLDDVNRYLYLKTQL